MKKTKIVGLLMYLLGFIGYVIFLSLVCNINTDAWLYAIGASICTSIFRLGIDLMIES